MPVPRWVHPANKVALLGDSCHPTLPYLSQGRFPPELVKPRFDFCPSGAGVLMQKTKRCGCSIRGRCLPVSGPAPALHCRRCLVGLRIHPQASGQYHPGKVEGASRIASYRGWTVSTSPRYGNGSGQRIQPAVLGICQSQRMALRPRCRSRRVICSLGHGIFRSRKSSYGRTTQSAWVP